MTSSSSPARAARNDRSASVTRFCLAMEEHRRTDAGRVRSAREMLEFFFPRSEAGAEDRIFLHIPPEVRGPIVSSWGVRGVKSAIRDSDEKVKQVVFDALAAGDIDEASFEQGIDPATLIDWVVLSEWWSFWRSGKLTGPASQKALAVGRELGLFDDRWFLQNVEGRNGKLKGTETLCDTLSKDQLTGWIRKLHESGDGSPAGLVKALGWETILAKTSQDALLFALDAFATKVGLVVVPAPITERPKGDEEPAPAPEIPRAPNLPGLPGPPAVAAPASAEEPPISVQELEPTPARPKSIPPPLPTARKSIRTP